MSTTDPQQELLIEVDKNNQIIGPITRSKAHNKGGKYYRTIFVLIINNQKEILLQKRSATKDLYPNCWDLSVCGHVAWGDGYLQTATKELREELGIITCDKDLKFLKQVLVTLPNSFEYFYVYKYQLKESDNITVSKAEVESTKWLQLEKIKKWTQDNPSDWYARPIQVIDSLSTL